MSPAHALSWLTLPAPEPVLELAAHEPLARWGERDGVLVEVWPGVLRAVDLAAGPGDRARMLGAHVPPKTVVARQAAVWVHTGGFRPATLDVIAVERCRSTAHVQVHAEPLAPGDVVRLGGVAVTSIARTALDVARRAPEAQARDWVAALRRAGLTGDEAADAVRRAGPRPGIARARRVLDVPRRVAPG